MFWRFGGYASISTLDTILDKPDVTVEDLLDESDLIQELKQQNSKLIEFLRDEPVLKKLLNYVVSDSIPSEADEKKEKDEDATSAEEGKERSSSSIPFFGKGKSRSRSKSVSQKDADGETEQEKKEAQRKRYAYVACEVLSSEVWSITEAILEHQDHLRALWQYMYRPAPLDPLQAGYFTKVNETLLDKKTEAMLTFFRSLDGIVPAMLQHVDCPMIMDLLLKTISLEKHEGGAGIVDWLQTQDLIPLLLSFLSPEHSSATQTSAGDFLKAIITISANATTQDQSVIGPNELTRQLVSEPCVATLISDMLQGGNPLTVGVGIIIEVIRKNNSDYDLDNQAGPEPRTSDPIYLGTLLRQFAEHIPDFMRLIRSPSAKRTPLRAAFGGTVEPLGFDRFKTCELMAELLHCSNMALLNECGAEDEVRKRDSERERLKAEGKLTTPKPPRTPNQENSHDEFGSSVDSHGFHHAERPSEDEMGRKLEVQNASDEDGFEKVNVDSDDLPDEVTFDEDLDRVDGLVPLSKAEKPASIDTISAPRGASPEPVEIPQPLSPRKPSSPAKSNVQFDPPPTQAADSPTTAGVTEQIDRLDVDEDTVMTEFGEEPTSNSDDEGPSELDKALATQHPEDKPAPLFVRKEASDLEHGEVEESNDIDQSVATIQGEPAGATANGQRAPCETEADGRPVVGDFLKIQFVEHQVVPTILDFFFRFPWNNFLHNVVYDVVQQVFNGTLDRGYNRTLAFDVFESTNKSPNGEPLGLVSTKDITDRILDGQAASDASQVDRGMRLGYMGHLTLIAEEVCKFGNRHPPEVLDQIVHDRVTRPEWITYVDGTLTETRDKDNAVLGGVRPHAGIGMAGGGAGLQGGGGGGGFTSHTANTLASAGIGGGGMMTPQDSLALSEGSVGQSFEINSGTMLSGFGDGGEEDEEMEEEERGFRRDGGGEQAGRIAMVDDDEQTPIILTDSPDAESRSSGSTTIPPPLNIPPSRARRQLAARLAARKAEGGDATATLDPDSADSAALALSEHLPEDPSEIIDLAPAAAHDIGTDAEDLEPSAGGLHVSGVGGVKGGVLASGSASRFSGLFNSSDDSSGSSDEGRSGHYGEEEGDEEEEERGKGFGVAGKERRPSTTEAKVRRPLYDDDDVVGGGGGGGHGEGPFADPIDLEDEDDGEEVSSEEDDMVEIRPRRTS